MIKYIFLGVVAIWMAMTPTSSSAQHWGEGQLVQSDFLWTNGGGDPYRGSLDNALQLGGITDALVRGALVQLVAAHPRGNAARFTIQDGDRLGVMVSGQIGWVARQTVAMPSQWRSNRSREVSVWYWRDPATGVQYRLMKADVCGNWIIQYYGAAELCRCDRRVDAC